MHAQAGGMDTFSPAAAGLAWHFDPELLRRHDRPGRATPPIPLRRTSMTATVSLRCARRLRTATT